MNRNIQLIAMFVLLGTLLPNTIHVEALQGKILTPTADSDVLSDGPDENMGREWSLNVERFVFSYNSERLAFLKFDLQEIPTESSISEAKLRMYAGEVDIKALVGAHYCSSNDWNEDEIAYNNKPSFSETPTDTLNVTTALKWYEWNVTKAAQTALSAADKKLSLAIKADTNGWIIFRSKDNPYALPQGGAPDTRPQLSVSYVAPPSGNDSTLTTLIIIIAIGIVAVGLEITYIRLKHKKTPEKQPTPETIRLQHLLLEYATPYNSVSR